MGDEEDEKVAVPHILPQLQKNAPTIRKQQIVLLGYFNIYMLTLCLGQIQIAIPIQTSLN